MDAFSETKHPRIALIHAIAESQPPIVAALAKLWPEARICNLLDDALAFDLAADGGIVGASMINRFRRLARYAAESGSGGNRTAGILFTCNAFGTAIDEVKREHSIPVLKPNEAAFERALQIGPRIGLLGTFPSALPSVLPELQAMAKLSGIAAVIETKFVPGALDALRQGNPAEHDRLVAEAAASLPECDVLVLSQMSMARAAAAVANRTGRMVLTTPEAAVEKLRALVLKSPE
jgi:Asp/Glu/hydantoin racemase